METSPRIYPGYKLDATTIKNMAVLLLKEPYTEELKLETVFMVYVGLPWSRKPNGFIACVKYLNKNYYGSSTASNILDAVVNAIYEVESQLSLIDNTINLKG